MTCDGHFCDFSIILFIQKTLSQSHDSAENQFLVFLLHAVWQEGGVYQVEPFHDRAAELLGDVVDYLVAEA